MRHLPFDDPGRPDLRSPFRYLVWTGRLQLANLLVAVCFGVTWMVAQALVPAAIGKGLDAGVADQDLTAAAWWSSVVLLLALIQAGAGILRHRLAVDNWLRASFRAMQLLGRHSAQAGVAVRRRLPTGEIVSAATNDALYIGGAFDILARLAGAFVSYVVVAILLLNTSAVLGLVVLVGVPLMMLVIVPLMRPLQRRQHHQRDISGHLTALGADTVSGLRVLRGIGGEPAFLQRYRIRSQELRRAGIRVAGLQATLDASQVLLPGVFLVGVTWLGARLAVEGELTPGAIVAFYGYAFFLVVPIRTAVEAVDKFTRSTVGARRIIAVLSTEPDIKDAPTGEPSPARGSELRDGRSGLAVAAGRFTGIVSADPDESAEIAYRLGRLVDDDSVTFGPAPLKALPLAEVRRRVLVSETHPRLFTGVLREELDPWGRSDGDAALLDAIHVAAGEDVLEALSDGLDEEVDEGGRGFSGGQRQRLALARAVVADPEVLVLVEPTSSVDAHTEALVAKRLRDARHADGSDGDTAERTTVVTSASPLVLDRCDTVAFVRNGRVVATGTHRSLLAERGDYRDTVTRGEEQ